MTFFHDASGLPLALFQYAQLFRPMRGGNPIDLLGRAEHKRFHFWQHFLWLAVFRRGSAKGLLTVPGYCYGLRRFILGVLMRVPVLKQKKTSAKMPRKALKSLKSAVSGIKNTPGSI